MWKKQVKLIELRRTWPVGSQIGKLMGKELLRPSSPTTQLILKTL
jgi:hypothetical protein